MGIFNKIFHTQTEDEYIDEIIENNKNNDEYESVKKTVQVVMYSHQENSPAIQRICDFHQDDLPQPDTIIWAPNQQRTMLVPYKVARLDHLEDEDDGKPSEAKTLIVVKFASAYDLQ